MSKITAKDIGAAFAMGMRDFGYPDVTAEMGLEVYEAWKVGKRGDELPHGVIGRFGESQFDDLKERADRAGRAMP